MNSGILGSPTTSESPAKGGQIVVHQAAAARTIVAVTFPPVFIFVCVVQHVVTVTAVWQMAPRGD